MKRLSYAFVLSGLLLAACSGERALTVPGQLAPPVTSAHDYTEADWQADGSPAPSLGATQNPYGAFVGTQWKTHGELWVNHTNDAAAVLVSKVLKNEGGVLNEHTKTWSFYQVTPTYSLLTANLQDSVSTLNHTCGITGTVQLTGHASVWVVKNPLGLTELQRIPFDESGADVTRPNCAAPKADVNVAYGGLSGGSITIPSPNGLPVDVSFSGSGSLPGETGGWAVTGYSWSGAASGSASSTAATLYSSSSYGLTVTDESGATGTSSGSITIQPVYPCDDPMTGPTEVNCEEYPGGPPPSYGSGGTTVDHEPGPAQGQLKWVCDVTVWFDWTLYGGQWSYVYAGTTINGCWQEE